MASGRLPGPDRAHADGDGLHPQLDGVGLSTFTAQTPAVDAVTTRLIRPIFVKGQGGVLRWSVTVTPLAIVDLDVQAQVIFLDDDDAQVGRWTGQEYHIEAAIVLSARLAVPRLATQAQLKVLSPVTRTPGSGPSTTRVWSRSPPTTRTHRRVSTPRSVTCRRRVWRPQHRPRACPGSRPTRLRGVPRRCAGARFTILSVLI